MPRMEIKIGGFGGQGVILSGYIIGRAASIYDNKFATMIQAFGPEARGSSTSAQLIVSDEPIAYPYITAPNLMILMSQEAYVKFSGELVPGGTLITEENLVTPHKLRTDIMHYSIPAARFAEEWARWGELHACCRQQLLDWLTAPGSFFLRGFELVEGHKCGFDHVQHVCAAQ